jgi:predicted DNA-binding transcriptional regulator AlpA
MIKPDELPNVLRKQDLAQILRTSQRTVDRYQRAGALPEPLTLPGAPRWSRASIEQWLDGSTGRRGRR